MGKVEKKQMWPKHIRFLYHKEGETMKMDEEAKRIKKDTKKRQSNGSRTSEDNLFLTICLFRLEMQKKKKKECR